MMEDSEDKNLKSDKFSKKVIRYFKNLFNFSQFDVKTIIYIIIFIILIGLSLLLLYYIYFVDKTFLYRLIVDWFVNPIFNLGFIGILLFLIIMGVQGLLVPIPSEIILLATGIIWGFIGGGIMGITGSMCAAMLCFYISKKGGRPLVKKFIGEKAIDMADNFIRKYGMGAILIARFLPFVAFDPISYVSGLVDIDVKKYALGTLIGSIPRAFFYSFLGAILGITPPIDFSTLPLEQVEAQATMFNNILLIILAVLLVLFIIYYSTTKIIASKQEKSN
ncbi:MAG: TVP38/TMEM64 family protein [Promethearchaeota archaeon]